MWVDPVTDGADRTNLDSILREVAARGVWVSAHPDTIVKMGTKEVLYRTRELGWGSETDLYRTVDEFNERFPASLSAGSARVLKQYRGNGGIGVQKVELVTPSSRSDEAMVRVQSARLRDEETADMPLEEFMRRCAKYFAYSDGNGRLIDQPFQPRITEGIIRCYLVKGEVVGFARQYPAASPPGGAPEAPRRIFGLPSPKTMFAPDEPAFASLRAKVESEWVPAMQTRLDVDDAALPALWDADFLFGPQGWRGPRHLRFVRDKRQRRASLSAGGSGEARPGNARRDQYGAIAAITPAGRRSPNPVPTRARGCGVPGAGVTSPLRSDVGSSRRRSRARGRQRSGGRRLRVGRA